MARGKPFTESELLIIKDWYGKKGLAWTCRLLETLGYPRSQESVRKRAQKMGLQSPNPACFPKGHIPWNKDKCLVMPHNAGNFPKGHMPKNHKPVGSISYRRNYKRGSVPVIYIKVAEPKKWLIYPRYVWEQHHGKVPKGMLVAHKDGDWENNCIDNLELITRSENVKRNRNLVEAKRTMGSDELTDKYCAIILARQMKCKWYDIIDNKELIELKRQDLLLKRQIKSHNEKK